MGQSMVYNSNNYSDYTERIRILRSNGDHLLQRIQLLETNMNKKKQQQNQQVNQNEITSLHCLVTKLLQMLAEINVCQYFQMVNEYYNFNDCYYKQMCHKYFQDLMQQFNSKIKAICLNQIKCYLINKIDKIDIDDDNDDDDDIDFSISR